MTNYIYAKCEINKEEVKLRQRAGIHYCPSCNLHIELERDESTGEYYYEHEMSAEVKCPILKKSILVSLENDGDKCECGFGIYVENGAAWHEEITDIECPVNSGVNTDISLYGDAEYSCGFCNGSIIVKDYEAWHEEVEDGERDDTAEQGKKKATATLELDILNEDELSRAAKLIGIPEKKITESTTSKLKKMIRKQVNPNTPDVSWKEQYRRACVLFKIPVKDGCSIEKMKQLLHEETGRRLEKAYKNLKPQKKKLLEQQLQESMELRKLNELNKSGKLLFAGGAGIGLAQTGAIALTASNLGICMLMTTGLSWISGIIGVTFPWAAYTSAAVAGGAIISAGNFLSSFVPVVLPVTLGITAYGVYRKITTKPLIKLAGVNYIIETKKKFFL